MDRSFLFIDGNLRDGARLQRRARASAAGNCHFAAQTADASGRARVALAVYSLVRGRSERPQDSIFSLFRAPCAGAPDFSSRAVARAEIDRKTAVFLIRRCAPWRTLTTRAQARARHAPSKRKLFN
eukprot:IDg11442t1